MQQNTEQGDAQRLYELSHGHNATEKAARARPPRRL
jgi:hypothetical protein